MNTVIKTLYLVLSVCLVSSSLAGCITSPAAPPEENEVEQSNYQLEIDLLGTRHELLVDSRGGLKANVAISSADAGPSLLLDEGTTIKDKDGKPLQVIDVSLDPSPPRPPVDAYIIGAVYCFSPEGASFKPQIELTISYDSEELPEGLKETDIYVACYQDAGWEKLLYKNIDTERHKITTQIDDFARFAVLAPGQRPTSEAPSAPADRIEVIYFHRAQRCSGCLYAEAGTRYTLESYFADELSSGKLTFQVLNVEDEGNAGIAEKYGAYTSSLFINTIRDGTDYIEEVAEIWFFLGEDKAFVEVVKSKIEKSLKGET